MDYLNSELSGIQRLLPEDYYLCLIGLVNLAGLDIPAGPLPQAETDGFP